MGIDGGAASKTFWRAGFFEFCFGGPYRGSWTERSIHEDKSQMTGTQTEQTPVFWNSRSMKLPVNLLLAVGLALGGDISGPLVVANQPVQESPAQPDDAEAEPIDRAIDDLIRDLANPSYARRVRARRELERMGLRALDAIRDASESPETEISFAARFLMSDMAIEWAKESDPEGVRSLLQEYEKFNDTDRRSAMDRLSNLPDWQGLVPLVRLARYEKNLKLSRHAALLAVKFDHRAGNPDEVVIRKVREEIGESGRVAATWLRQFCEDVTTDNYNAKAWRELVEAERELVELSSNGSRTDPLTLLDLYRVCATRALQDQKRDEALMLALEGLDNLLPRTSDLLDAVGWALDSQLYEVVFELKRREPQRFATEPALIYGLAEAHKIAGDEIAAEKVRLSALEIEPLPISDGEDSGELSRKRIEEIAMRHHEIGRVLENRGLFDWAEGEYRHIIDRLPIDAPEGALIRFQLAFMLGSLNQHRKVVGILQPLVERLQKDDVLKAKMRKGPTISYEDLAAKMSYHAGLAAEGEEARESLMRAQRFDGGDIDILIAMHRQQGDEKWQARVKDDVRRMTESWMNRIERAERSMRTKSSDASIRRELASACNQYAWLVANTDGDIAPALRLSKQAVELFPNESAYLDTLARCFFVAGDLEQAINYQQLALGVDPHLPPLKRQLEFFEQQREKNSATGEKQKAEEIQSRENDAKPTAKGTGDS